MTCNYFQRDCSELDFGTMQVLDTVVSAINHDTMETRIVKCVEFIPARIERVRTGYLRRPRKAQQQGALMSDDKQPKPPEPPPHGRAEDEPRPVQAPDDEVIEKTLPKKTIGPTDI